MASAGLAAQVLHAALLLAAAPLLAGVADWARARLDGRRGASPAQPYRDLRRAMGRRPVLAEGASPVSVGAPLLAVAALALAAGLLPPVALLGLPATALGPAPVAAPAVGAAGGAPAVSGDLVLLAALLGLARAALASALLDTGTAAGGLGAARLWARPVLFEPVLLLLALSAATLAGAEASGSASAGTPPPLLLAAAALLLLAASETPAPPVAGGGASPLPHDLGDAPEAVGHEFSGWHRALWDYARALRRAVFLVLLAALLPGPPPVPAEAGAAGDALRAVFGWAELFGLSVVLAAVEGGAAVLHPARLPALGVGALACAAVAAALLLLAGVAA